MLSKQDFKVALRNELESNITLEHSIFDMVMGKEPNWELLRLMAVQGYQLTKHFLDYVETLFYFCPIPLHRRRLLHNLYEEETGKLSRTDNHVVLMQNFIRAIGISDAERDSVTALPETEELITYRMNLVKNPDTYHLGAAAVMIASEGQNLETKAGQARDKLLPMLYGLTEADLLFFSVHQKEDVGHVKEGIELVSELCTTEQMQQDALAVVKKTCQLFHGMYTGVERFYLENNKLQGNLV